jgi:predicted transcriptional regulator
MTRPRETLGPLERNVLRYIADHHPITVREAAAYFEQTSGQARTTVLTVMTRLRAKGYLKRRKSGGVQRYVPTLSKVQLLRQFVGEFVDDVLNGSVSPFVAYLSQTTKLSTEEIHQLQSMLKRIESREQEGDS